MNNLVDLLEQLQKEAKADPALCEALLQLSLIHI